MKYSKFRKFITNDITLLVVSFIIAFIIWFIISSTTTTDTNVTISDIPITIELPQEAVDDGLQIFSGNDVKGSVQVTGNRVTVGSLSGDDIQITASNSSTIITTGTYTLQLAAKQVGSKNNYNIIPSSLNPSTITIFVDKYKEKEFEIDNQIKFEVPEGSYGLSTLSVSKVKLSGPESEISKISSVAVQANIEGVISSTMDIQKSLIYLDDKGESVTSPLIESNVDTVVATLSVLQMQEVEIKVNVLNGPNVTPTIKLSPSSLTIAAEKKIMDEISTNKLAVASIDFATLTNREHINELEIELPSGVKNLSDQTMVVANIDLSDCEKRELTCSLKYDLDDTEYDIQLSDKSINVTVYGSQEEISSIKAVDVEAMLDFGDSLNNIKDKTVSLDVPVKFVINNDYETIWVYGSYKITANVTKK